MPNRLVIDTSVAVKWFLKDPIEDDTDLADDILVALLADDLELHAPRIFTYEVSGVLTKACKTRGPGTNRPRLAVQHAIDCVRELFGLPIHVSEPTEHEAIEALQMAVDYSKTHDDMTFLRLANIRDCQWCTADTRVLEGGDQLGSLRHRVLLLSTIPPSA